MNLSNTAQRSLKTHGGYACKAPKVPYRFICTDQTALMSYNKLYVMGFIRGLNEGFKVWRTESGRVTSNFNHGGSWVWAQARNDSDVFGGLADVYMTLNEKDANGKSIGSVVGYIIAADHPDAKYAVDFASEQSDNLGFFVNPHTKLTSCPSKWERFNNHGIDVDALVPCHDEDGHDGEPCTCS